MRNDNFCNSIKTVQAATLQNLALLEAKLFNSKVSDNIVNRIQTALLKSIIPHQPVYYSQSRLINP
jgi:hypothetical protein